MSRAGAALAAAEQAARPELPLPGFLLTRQAGDEWPIVLDTHGRLLHDPGARVQRASSDGTHLALEVAGDGTEAGHLILVDRSGGARRVETPPLRYGEQAWSAAGVLHVVDETGRCFAVDSRTSPLSARVVRDTTGERLRLTSLAGRVVLALARSDSTDLIDTQGRALLSMPPIRALGAAGHNALAVTDTGLHLLRAHDTGVAEASRRTLDPTTDGVPVHATATPDGCALHLVREGHSHVVTYDRELCRVRELAVSGADDVATVSGLAWSDGRTWARIETPAQPPRLLDVGDSQLPREVRGPRSRLVTIEADDGTPIDLVLTGDAPGPAPTLLEVYGGFGVVEVPAFEPSVAAWCELGGLHVTARVRGGGGAGSAWHEAARGVRKGRAVADTVAVARALVARGVTHPRRLVVAGASHGGLVAASAALAEPGLVAASCVTAAPVDPHRLLDNPLGPAWTTEFGDPADPAVRAAMDEYAPLARLDRWPTGAPLPRFLLTTFAEDTRVEPGATDRLADALRERGATVARHHRPAMGHGRNGRSQVHTFSASVLDFAQASTGA
jgi:dipeptidyl aminopeptidase/acylaminoacyl peptidase